MIIKLLEMTYKRSEVKDAIDNHISQMLQNWCLAKAAIISNEPRYLHYYHHWVDELCAQVEPGIDKMLSKGMSEKSRRKLVDEVFFSDAHIDKVDIVYHRILAKFVKNEHMSYDLCRQAAEAWVSEGLPFIRDVYIHDSDIINLSDTLYALVPEDTY